MFNIGPVEFIVIVVLALVVFGPEKLPELLRGAGQAIREFQRASRELTEVFQETQEQFTGVIHDTREEFSQALSLNEPLMPSSSTTSNPPAGSAATESSATAAQQTEDLVPVESEVPVVASAPSARELETAAGMLDDIVALDSGPGDVNGNAGQTSTLLPVAAASAGVSAAAEGRRPRRRKAERSAGPVDEEHALGEATSNGAEGTDSSPTVTPASSGTRRPRRVAGVSAGVGDGFQPIGSALGEAGDFRSREDAARTAPRPRERGAAPAEAGD